MPFAPKALYLSFYGIGNRTLCESALDLIEVTDLNALVIDVKGIVAVFLNHTLAGALDLLP